MPDPLPTYARHFSTLRADRSNPWGEDSRGQAPHKPLLLLSVIDQFAEGTIFANLIELTPELGELFDIYWAIVRPMGRERGNVATPFFHMRSEGFWHLQPKPGYGEYIRNTSSIQSVTRLQESAFGAKLDEPLFELLCSDDGRETLRRVLIETYFHPRLHQRLLHQGVVNVKAFHYGETLLQRAKKQIKEPVAAFATAVEETAVRDQGFRRAIVRAYEHRCALCGVRILTADGHTAIEAAHIVPWSESQNDDPRNGLALCRLCHWTFDEGLATIRTNYCIQLSPQLSANDNIPGHLATMDDRPFIAPPDRDLWPFPESLDWHRRHTFRQR